MLTEPVKVADAIANDCCDALESFSRFIGKNPDAGSTLVAQLLLPPGLFDPAAPALVRLRDKIGALVSGDGGVVQFGQVVDATALASPGAAKVTPTLTDRISRALGAIGIGLEPDPRYGGRVPALTEHVALFVAPGGGPIDGERQAFRAARARVRVGVLAAQTIPGNSLGGFQVVTREIGRIPGLSPTERTRLRAYLMAAREAPPSPKAVVHGLAACSLPEREAIASVALGALAAHGQPGPAQVKFAEQLYRALKLPPDRLYADLHARQPGGGTEDDLPLVSAAESSVLGIALPDPPAMPGNSPTRQHRRSRGPASAPSASLTQSSAQTADGRVLINERRLAQTRLETIEVQVFMAEIFTGDISADTSTSGRSSDATASSPATSAYPGLASQYAGIVDLLRARTDPIARSDLQATIATAGLFLEAAIEVINDWAYGNFDEPLIDEEPDGKTFQVAVHLLDQLKPAA